MKVVIATQHYENYGAHDWDGNGSCPQYWKAKGGSYFQITGLAADCDMEAIVDCVRDRVEFRNEGFESTIIGVSLEQDSWMSPFEKSQLEYDGAIVYKEPSVTWTEIEQEILGPVFDYEYADWCADLDAHAYGEIA